MLSSAFTSIPLADVLEQTNDIAKLDSRVIVVGLLLAALSFIVSWALGKPLLKILRAKRIGKRIQAELPDSHKGKTGTLTMGGIMIVGAVVLVAIAFTLVPAVINVFTRSEDQDRTGLSVLLPIGVLIASSVLGAIDDLLTLVNRTPVSAPPPVAAEGETKRQRRRRERQSRRGLTARFKFSWLFIMAIGAAIVMYVPPLGLTKVYIPFIRTPIELAFWLYIPIAVIAIVGTANAVNLTDGLDTLAGSTCLIAFVAYGIIGFLQGQPQVVYLAFATAGACMGFLWYNAHPAQVFMGDTGSLALGSLLAILAFQTNQWILLPLIGGVFVLEAGSVILQVLYFKWTKGKRLFKMSPIHLHFQKSGWSETQVTMRFFLFGIVVAIIGVALALI